MTLRGLKDKVVIVTGAAAGIGRATVRRFAEEGCRVAAWDLNAAAQAEIGREVREEEDRGLFRKMNVADAVDVEAAVAEVVDRWGRIDVLVNNAGIVRDDQLVKWKDGAVAKVMADDTFDAVISVNLKGVFHCARAVVPHMIRAGGGVILNASSIVGLYGNFGQTGVGRDADRTANDGLSTAAKRVAGRDRDSASDSAEPGHARPSGPNHRRKKCRGHGAGAARDRRPIGIHLGGR